jgi:hypothetical protein
MIMRLKPLSSWEQPYQLTGMMNQNWNMLWADPIGRFPVDELQEWNFITA